MVQFLEMEWTRLWTWRIFVGISLYSLLSLTVLMALFKTKNPASQAVTDWSFPHSSLED